MEAQFIYRFFSIRLILNIPIKKINEYLLCNKINDI
uniref:Uncharacterized protein n=1 Tax=viral metagenome TaxID=1070528 RepID=A0A6C0H8W5_9ZZZZ